MAIPPGLSSTKDFPPLAAPQPAVPPKLQRKAATATVASPVIKPVVPVLSSQPPRTALPNKDASDSQASAQKDQQATVSSSAQVDKPLPEPIHKAKSKTKTSTSETLIQQRPKNRPKGTLSLDVPAAKGTNTQPKPDQKASGTAVKRQLPGKLDIAAAKEASREDTNAGATSSVREKPRDDIDAVASSSVQDKSRETTPSVAPVESRPATPATPVAPASHASGSSTARQTQPRTLRVIPTPIAETPPRLPSTSPASANIPPSSAVKRQHSRRGSFASVQLPGTPMSERISDNASFTSASISRANTPPPTKIGSTPVRQISKSQQKKERQARAKLVEGASKAQDAPVAAIAEKPEQAPIVGRKKKAKKTAASGTADSTPTVTRPSSPTIKEEGAQRNVSASAQSNRPITSDFSNAQRERVEGENPASPGALSGADQQSKNSLTAAAILSKLQKSGDISPTVLNIFKGVAGANYRFELSQADFAESETGPILSADQARQINEGEAITFDYPSNKRIVILPDRRLLRGLSAEQAQRYLDLRKQIISTSQATAFHPPRHSIDRYLHAVPNRGRSVNASNGHGSDQSYGLENRFISPPPIQASTSTMPAYWSASPLSEDGIVRRSSVLGVDEAEQAMSTSRKETDGIDKRLNALLKRNRKLVFGNTH